MPENIEVIERYNAVIDKANSRMRELRASGRTCRGQLSAQGVQITIYRPTFRDGYRAVSTEIIPW